ncbi:MAG: CAP domain-containing protein [Verrucomicrobiota bacterium]
MKILTFAAFAFFATLLLCQAQVPLTGGPRPNVPGQGESNPYVEKKLFELVNRYRTDKGLPPFKLDARLSEVARQNAMRLMAKGFVDCNLYCVRLEEVLAIMPDVCRYGENKSFSFPKKENLAGELLQGWLHSQRHQHHLINDYQYAGVAVICNPNGERFTIMNFAKECIEPGKQTPKMVPTEGSAPAPGLQQPQQADGATEAEDIYGLSLN